jgi:hypothetical protein
MGTKDPIEKEASAAVNRICNKPSIIFEESLNIIPQSEGSSVIFLHRAPNDQDEFKHFIPTPHLWALFEEQRSKLASKEALELFLTLSSHSFTRPAAGWAYEISLHRRLALGGADLTIFQGPTEWRNLRASTRLLPGSLDGLKYAGLNDSFYWIPSVTNFPGVDCVLGDTGGHVYAIQATISGTHTSPEQGIEKVWKQFSQEVRASRTWHFVVVTNRQTTAEEYVKHFQKKLLRFRLGQAPVQVWACAYSP